MDEFTAVQRARRLVSEVAPGAIPTPVEAYVEHVGAKLRVEDLPANESGYTMELRGKHHIAVNGNDRSERQRFTACHELGHIVLDLPSEHGETPWWSYERRPENEKLCDVFAAELLLPHTLFRPEANGCDPGFTSIESLAARFDASLTATGSRFAAVASLPCAFVLAERGRIRYASRSATLRAAGAWIAPRSPLPGESIAAHVREVGADTDTSEIEADHWFSDWTAGGIVLEEARHLPQWDQTLTLLWLDDVEELESAPMRHQEQSEAEDSALSELDGHLPWPSNKRRR